MLGLILLSAIFQTDTIATNTKQLDEVVVVAHSQTGKRSPKGAIASIDEHLQELNHVDLVRRGAYAWEPNVNNMQTERLSTTIDGMKIFYACTDKMDPVTSYVESSNLQNISLNSGLDGNPQATGNIGGALDLRLRKAGFDNTRYSSTITLGYEGNGHLQVYGGDATYSSHKIYANGGVFYRNADNYKAGGGREVEYSQFQKVNAFVNTGLRLSECDVTEATLIFDRASNVGYPALNMDVAKAEAFITSLSYKHLFEGKLDSWETKVYYNHITHVMDDTKRPDVEIHMDMPGKSWTAGAYSLLAATTDRHSVQFNIDGYYNRLFADMTMYPGGAAPMYMVTWPDVGTLNLGTAVTDNITLSKVSLLRLSAKLSWQNQRLNNEEGYKALNVFFPGMSRQYYQTTGRLAASYRLSTANNQFTIGAGWGSRAPTVTEAYGYYLNNTFDQYDYIGNPRLKNENAFELNGSYKRSMFNGKYSVLVDANAFFFNNYIIGQFETRLCPMTVDAEGVKVYGNINHATIANSSITMEWNPIKKIRLTAKGSYSIGLDDEGEPLPLISPFSYSTRLTYDLGPFNLNTEVKGHTQQSKNGKKYGENKTNAWTICNLSATYVWRKTTLRAGVENLFDRYYATYTDWCHIPQKGRNLYMNISYVL